MGSRELLLLRCGDRFGVVDGALPGLAGDFELQDSIAPVCAAALRAGGGPGILTLRLLGASANLNVFDCESAPHVGSWRSLDEVDAYVDADQAAAVRSGDGAPWYAPEFHARLLGFASTALAEAGVESRGAPEQVRVSPLSCIYRLPCRGVDHWVKATRPRAFVPEGAVMAALHSAFPALVPAPLAMDDDVALFADFGERMRQTTPHDQVAEAAAQLARLQLGGDGLLDTPGLQSWRLADLPGDLAASRPVLGPEAERLLDRLTRDVEALAACGIGDHLVHGDFYWGNIALDGGAPRFFDWSDAGIGHPFFDLLEAFASEDAERREGVAAAYLGVWRGASDGDVDAAWPLARRLGPAHNLARNTRLLSHLESWERPTVEGGQRFWARLTREAFERA